MPSGKFHVLVDGFLLTEHDVTLRQEDLDRLGGGRSPAEFIIASFEFLLERESNKSILDAFDLMEIGKYFPEYEKLIAS